MWWRHKFLVKGVWLFIVGAGCQFYACKDSFRFSFWRSVFWLASVSYPPELVFCLFIVCQFFVCWNIWLLVSFIGISHFELCDLFTLGFTEALSFSWVACLFGPLSYVWSNPLLCLRCFLIDCSFIFLIGMWCLVIKTFKSCLFGFLPSLWHRSHYFLVS